MIVVNGFFGRTGHDTFKQYPGWIIHDSCRLGRRDLSQIRNLFFSCYHFVEWGRGADNTEMDKKYLIPRQILFEFSEWRFSYIANQNLADYRQ